MQKSKTPNVSDIRTKGQVWTPRWVADAMAVYLGSRSSNSILDPAVGPGVLLVAAKNEAKSLTTVIGYEIDPAVLSENSTANNFAESDFTDLRLKDFILDRSKIEVDAVIANPPYLRHHKIPWEVKNRCQEIVQETLGIRIDARAGLHIYFLVKALSHLNEGGRLSFLVPADTFEGVFSKPLWLAIAKKYRVEGILTFDPKATAFPGVDTNASIIFIEKSKPTGEFNWLRWLGEDPSKLAEAVRFGLANQNAKSEPFGLHATQMALETAIETGFTRLHTSEPLDGVPLNEFATMMRGVASGSNEFFLMTKARLRELGLSEDDFVRTVPRVRDATTSTISLEFLNQLDASGRPTYLLSVDQDTEIKGALKKYLELGVNQQINMGALVSTRKNWYFMEKRRPVPILFAYLGRRNNRFIDAQTDITPLTGFLCVYPRPEVDKQKLLKALNHPSSIQELSRIGKSYGDGAVKVEPGGLRKMVIPLEALTESGLIKST